MILIRQAIDALRSYSESCIVTPLRTRLDSLVTSKKPARAVGS
jgi:hypothetical protein